MNLTEKDLRKLIATSNSREKFWTDFLNLTRVKRMVELGVYRGDFAETILKECAGLKKYYMIDPWKHLDSWNKPANRNNEIFEKFFLEVKTKTNFASNKRVVLRGKTTEVISKIPDRELDFAYIDGDHTLKGISIDLINLYPKIKPGGWIGGDDFSRTIWQHSLRFEPTLVFPFAVYFAEAVGAPIYALPYNQFLIEKKNDPSFSFADLTNRYTDTSLRSQVHPSNYLKKFFFQTVSAPIDVARKIRNLFRSF